MEKTPKPPPQRIRELMPDNYTVILTQRTGCKNVSNLSQIVRLEHAASKYWPAVLTLAEETNPDSNGVNYALLEARGITPWIPVFGKYKPETAGFTYDAETDCFTYLAGKTLPFKAFDKNQDGGLGKIYRAASRDCRLCPLKPTCAPKVKKRQLIRTVYAPRAYASKVAAPFS